MARADAVAGLAYLHVARCGEHTRCAPRSDATLVRLSSALGFSFAFGRYQKNDSLSDRLAVRQTQKAQKEKNEMQKKAKPFGGPVATEKNALT
jgi:hypothetical protein